MDLYFYSNKESQHYLVVNNLFKIELKHFLKLIIFETEELVKIRYDSNKFVSTPKYGKLFKIIIQCGVKRIKKNFYWL